MNPFRRWVVWSLMLALPICSASSTLAALLGARHFHATTAAHVPAKTLPAVWVDFRRNSQVASTSMASHSHSWLARHHHGSADDSVMALDAAAGDSSAGSSGSGIDGSVVLVLALLSGIKPWQVDALADAWPVEDASPLKSCDLRRVERPPRT